MTVALKFWNHTFLQAIQRTYHLHRASSSPPASSSLASNGLKEETLITVCYVNQQNRRPLSKVRFPELTNNQYAPETQAYVLVLTRAHQITLTNHHECREGTKRFLNARANGASSTRPWTIVWLAETSFHCRLPTRERRTARSAPSSPSSPYSTSTYCRYGV